GAALAVGDHDRDPRAGHARQEQRRRIEYFQHAQPALELLAAVAQELRPVRRTRDDLAELRQHLATVAHTERKGPRTQEERGELVAQHVALEDRCRPAASGTEHVAIAEAATGHQSVEALKAHASGDEVGHVYVDRAETGAVEADSHLDLAVDALLAQ